MTSATPESRPHGHASLRAVTGAARCGQRPWQRVRHLSICVLVLALGMAAGARSPPCEVATIDAEPRTAPGAVDVSLSASRKASISARLRDAKEAFVAQYPAGPEVDSAAQAFADVLFEKDLYFLVGYLLQGTDSDAAIVFDRVEGFTGGALDGGINPAAMALFGRRDDAVRAELGAERREQVIEPAAVADELAQAIARTMAVHREYEARRNALELEALMARQDDERGR